MRIMFINRRDWRRNGGGDVTQMLQVQRYATRAGFQADIYEDVGKVEKKVREYDLVHVFNAQRVSETLHYVRAAVRAGRPVIVSPMYDDFTTQHKHARSKVEKLLVVIFGDELYLPKDILRVVRSVSYATFLRYSLFRTFTGMFREVGRLTTVFIPNSRSELRTLHRMFGIPEEKMHVIPNTIEPEILEYPRSGDEFRTKFGIPFDKFVLSVSRFAQRKNPLNLLRAVKDAPSINLVLIAQRSPTNDGYYQECMRTIRGCRNVVVIEQPLPREELAGAYRACHVHALTSWVETPGLSSLEAGLFGANLVVGRYPAVEEYFQDKALYCRQEDPADIREQLLKALAKKRGEDGLKDEILKRFSWNQVGRQYIELYRRFSQGH